MDAEFNRQYTMLDEKIYDLFYFRIKDISIGGNFYDIYQIRFYEFFFLYSHSDIFKQGQETRVALPPKSSMLLFILEQRGQN